MKQCVVDACAILQSRIARIESSSHWRTEQAEEALSELVRHPDREGHPLRLAQNALSNARKKLDRRAALQERHLRSLTFGVERQQSEDLAHLVVELSDLLRQGAARDREILGLAAVGLDSEQIAVVLELPEPRVRERLSRARRRARATWAEAA